MKPKFYLIQRGDSANENILHVFDDAEARAAATCDMIYGQKPDQLDPDSLRGWKLYREELEDSGYVEFEGDPGLEWFTAITA